MSQSYVLSCCSTADLTKEHFASIDVNYICFHYQLDGKEYTDDLGQSMSFPDFYEAMAKGADTKTSQINADEFVDYFEGFLKEGKDILHVCLSSGLSGVLNSAVIAKGILEEKYPERKIIVVDSLGASSGYGLLMDKLASLRDEGYSLADLATWVEENKLNVHHWFFSTDLTYFVRGGRISKTSGLVGGVLGICPLLFINSEGKLIPHAKIRGKNKVIQELATKMPLHAQNGGEYSEKCFISHANCFDMAKQVADLVEQSFPQLQGKVEIMDIGTTIGSHTGPGTVALFFWGDSRMGT